MCFLLFLIYSTTYFLFWFNTKLVNFNLTFFEFVFLIFFFGRGRRDNYFFLFSESLYRVKTVCFAYTKNYTIDGLFFAFCDDEYIYETNIFRENGSLMIDTLIWLIYQIIVNKVASFAYKIHLSWLNDPYLAIHSSWGFFLLLWSIYALFIK